MNEEEITEDEYIVTPEKHDRWSLLVLATAFTGDLAKVLADYSATAAVMAAAHRLYKKEKSEFYEIVR